MNYPIINQGIVLDLESGKTYTFRSFINQPIGWSYLYPEEKDEHYIQMEMELINSNDKNMPVMFPAKTITDESGNTISMPVRIMPVYWDQDGLAHIACMQISVFAGIMSNDLAVTEIEQEFEEDHAALLAVYPRHYDRNELERLRGNG